MYSFEIELIFHRFKIQKNFWSTPKLTLGIPINDIICIHIVRDRIFYETTILKIFKLRLQVFSYQLK